MMPWQGVAASGLSEVLDQVAVAGNIAGQELVNAFPQVRTMDTYSLTAVSRGFARRRRRTVCKRLWWVCTVGEACV